MSSIELVEMALHVLVEWIDGRKPVSADLDILRSAFPSSAGLPADELACQMIHDLCGRTLMEEGQPSVEETGSARVA